VNTIRVTVGELLAAVEAFGVLKQKPLAALKALRVGLLIGRLKTDFEAANATKIEIFMKHGGVQSGAQVTVPAERTPALMAELDPVLKQRIEIAAEKLPIGLFGDNLSMTPEQMAALAPFIDGLPGGEK